MSNTSSASNNLTSNLTNHSQKLIEDLKNLELESTDHNLLSLQSIIANLSSSYLELTLNITVIAKNTHSYQTQATTILHILNYEDYTFVPVSL